VVPVLADDAIDVAALRARHRGDRDAGSTAFLVVGCAGTVAEVLSIRSTR
jgi:hypothetical protein